MELLLLLVVLVWILLAGLLTVIWVVPALILAAVASAVGGPADPA